MFAQSQICYNGNVLTYDDHRSQGLIVPIYYDVDGQLYMPINERFVTIGEVITAIENYQRNRFEVI